MKILVSAPYFYPKPGGLEYYSYNICKGLKKFGADIIVVTSSEGKAATEDVDGMKIYRLPYLFRLSNTPINPKWAAAIRKIIEKEKPDIINGHLPVPFAADIAARIAKEENIPFILTYHNDLVKDNLLLNFLSKSYYLLLGNATLDMSNRIIVTSEYYALKSPYLKAHSQKIEIVSPGVDINRFNLGVDEEYLKKKHGLKQKVILFVGQLDKTHQHKGLNYLIEAVGTVKKEINATLVVAGRGDYIDYYRRLAKKSDLEDEVIFTGYIADEELPYYYRGSDVFVLPSYTESEGFGMSLIEAMACGTPVIGTNIGGIPYVIEPEKDGLLVPPRDSKGLAGAIIRVLKNEDWTSELGKNGHKKVKNNFSWDKAVEKTFKIFSYFSP